MNYTELIEALRFCATDGDCHDCPIADCGGTMGGGLYLKAADAIETLQNKLEKIQVKTETETTQELSKLLAGTMWKKAHTVKKTDV